MSNPASLPSGQATEPQTLPGPSRQRRGNACEACRRRKLRCDREQPQCGLCAESGEECRFVATSARGPKKGHIKVLQQRIAALERAITSTHEDQANDATTSRPTGSPGSTSGLSYNDGDDIPDGDLTTVVTDGNGQKTIGQHQMTVKGSKLPSTNRDDSLLAQSVSWFAEDFWSADLETMPDGQLPDLLHSDRDQLYFDRVHGWVPIIHRHNYLTWSHRSVKPKAQASLQLIMWALATAATTQPRSTGYDLYMKAKQGLRELEEEETAGASVDVNQIQAWLLLSLYEFVHVDFRRGWMSAGHAFRLIQFLRLHEVDLESAFGPVPLDWVIAEERRRAFWFAYCLERYVNISNGSPPILVEQVHHVRLPAPGENFQSGQATAMGLLSDVAATGNTDVGDSFTEFVVLAELCGRTIAHRQQSSHGGIYLDTETFWQRHRSIVDVLLPRAAAKSLGDSPARLHDDPMLFFNNLMTQALVLNMYQLVTRPAPDPAHQVDITEITTASFTSSMNVSSLLQLLEIASCFKTHPFVAIALGICADHFSSFGGAGAGFQKEAHLVSYALRALQRVDMLAQHSADSVYCSASLTSV